jgi:hypothetical protein
MSILARLRVLDFDRLSNETGVPPSARRKDHDLKRTTSVDDVQNWKLKAVEVGRNEAIERSSARFDDAVREDAWPE